MEHAFRLHGSEHELWLSRSGPNYRLHVGDACIPVALAARGEHAYDLTVGDVTEPVIIVKLGDDAHIHLDGEAYFLRYADNLERFSGQDVGEHEAVARAPMPGAVISVAVATGDAVQRGQALLVIESMKMETTIVAPYDGVVQNVHVVTDQTFDRDAVLVTLERATEAKP